MRLSTKFRKKPTRAAQYSEKKPNGWERGRCTPMIPAPERTSPRPWHELAQLITESHLVWAVEGEEVERRLAVAGLLKPSGVDKMMVVEESEAAVAGVDLAVKAAEAAEVEGVGVDDTIWKEEASMCHFFRQFSRYLCE